MGTILTKSLPLSFIVKRKQVFFHPVRSLRFMRALILDQRIHAARKVAFVASVVALIIVLFLPDLLQESVLTAILPVLGTLLGIPLGAGLDWLTFALVSSQLFRIFPAEIVSEHYNAHILRQKDIELIQADSK